MVTIIATLCVAEKRKSFQLDLEDALSPPPISLSAPELSSRCIMPFKALRNAVSSTELLHERAMARFYKAVAMKEEQTKHKDDKPPKIENNINIPYTSPHRTNEIQISQPPAETTLKTPEIFIKSDSIEGKEYKYSSRQASHDSETSDSKWQQNSMSFDEDYTASTVSTDGEYSDEGSLNGDLDRRSQYSNEENTYNPRDKMAHPTEFREEVEEEEEEESEREVLKPLPLPDPSFIPKPILKRRELDLPEQKSPPPETNALNSINSIDNQIQVNEIPKKEEKNTLFKKFTKMPVQKPFQFRKILSKKEPEKSKKEILSEEGNKKTNKVEKIEHRVSEEGRTVIDYYGNIVKEFGGQKKPSTTLYLNTEDLKTVAEKQEKKEITTEEKSGVEKKASKVKKTSANKGGTNKVSPNKNKAGNSIAKPKPKPASTEKAKPEKKAKQSTPSKEEKQNHLQDQLNKKYTQQIVLKKTERATIVIPIDYQELEKKAKVTVRSAIDYMVDVCLLMLAFWVYFFKDERLAIPFLILIIYRQLQETLFLNIPEWVRNNTPSWIKKKTS